MLKISITVLCLSTLTSLAHAGSVGFRTVGIGGEGPRPLNVALWYPTEDTGTERVVGGTPAFVGVPVIDDAQPADGAHPLVVLSHGYGGTWRNLSWIAEALVRDGYTVAAPDHPGTTHFNKDARQAATLWERPHDLSRVIDALLANPDLAGSVDPDRIGAIGHSLGGWTVTAMAGARFDPELFAADCASGIASRACPASALNDMKDLRPDAPQLSKDMSDKRVRAFVSLDLGFARGFTPESLAAVTVPSLLISAGVDVGDRPAELETGWLAENLPAESTEWKVIPDATHFSFIQLCKPGAAEMIEAEDPGDGIVCRDGGDRSRSEIHDEVLGKVTEFLNQALNH